MECIQYATLPDDIVVIRVAGRANYQNSLALREVFEKTSTDKQSPQFIFDLEHCSSMDSTFMGVVASIGLHQRRLRGSKASMLNVNPHVRELLDLLGLKFLLEIRDLEADGKGRAALPDARYSAVPAPDISKLDRIIMMIEAHERLIDVDNQNEVKFRNVLETLHDSLERTGGKD
jgi:anti-anti-sigma factor